MNAGVLSGIRLANCHAAAQDRTWLSLQCTTGRIPGGHVLMADLSASSVVWPPASDHCTLAHIEPPGSCTNHWSCNVKVSLSSPCQHIRSQYLVKHNTSAWRIAQKNQR